jgi:hypothetical protein
MCTVAITTRTPTTYTCHLINLPSCHRRSLGYLSHFPHMATNTKYADDAGWSWIFDTGESREVFVALKGKRHINSPYCKICLGTKRQKSRQVLAPQ